MLLLIKSRFSWSYFAIIFVFLMYGGMAIGFSSLPTGTGYEDYYFAGILGMFSAVSIMLGGLSMTQSDSEFLMVSAVKRRELSYALYIAQYIYTGPIIFIAFLLYAFTANYSDPGKILIFFDVLLMSTVPVSLTVISTNVDLRIRLSSAAIFLAWVFSFLLGFQYSPISMFQGHLLQSVIPTMIFSVVILAIALFMLRSENLAYKLSNFRIRTSEYKNIRKYAGLSPWRAIFQYGFSQFEITTRTNFSGTPTLSGRRVRSNLILVIFLAVAVVYGYLAYRFNPTAEPNLLNFNFVMLFGGIYISIFPPLIMSGSTVPMERAWLSFTSMMPDRYLPLLTLSKVVQLIYLMSGFIAADAVLYFMGVYGALNNLILFLVYDPLFLVIFMAINYRLQNYQIKDEKLITSRYTASQFALIPPMLLFFAVAGASSVFIIVDVFAVPLIAVIAIFFLFWKKFWNNRMYGLVEKGFI